MDREIAQLVDLLRAARRAVVFTGAGISTESGIPDFRSPGGIWTKMMPVQFQDYIADPEARRVVLGTALRDGRDLERGEAQ